MAGLLDLSTLANRALSRIGAGSLQDLEEETDLAAQVDSVLEPTVALCLARYDWRWCRVTRALQKIAAEAMPPNGYRAGFAFPSNAIAGPHVVSLSRDLRAPLRDIGREGRVVYCDTDAETIYAAFTVAFSPDQWPPAFAEFCTMALAARLCVPVTHDQDLAERLEAQAWGSPREQYRGGLFALAVAEDEKTHSGYEALVGASDPLTSAWYGGW